MLIFICVFLVVFGTVVGILGKKTYSVVYRCSDPLATLNETTGVCTITRYVDCDVADEATCRLQLPDDGFSCVHKSVTEEDGGYSHEYLCTKAATAIEEDDITELTIPVSQVACPSNATYDGTVKTITVPSDTRYKILINGNENTQVKNAGTYKVQAKIVDTTQYKWPGTDSPTVTLKTCTISPATSKVTLSDATGSGKNGYLTSTTANISSKCDGKISIVPNGLTPTGSIASCPCAIDMDAGFKMMETNFKVTTTCKTATATIKFISDSDNCTDASATYTYTVEGGDNCTGVNPSSSSSSSKSSSSSSSKPSSSSSSGDVVTPINSIILSSDAICIDEYTSLSVSSSVEGEIVIVNGDSKVVKLSSSTYDLSANEEKNFKLFGLKEGTSQVEVRFIPKDTSKYDVIEKTYKVFVTNCHGDDNIETNPPTGNILLFLVWIVGLGAVGYSFYSFKYSFKN